MWCLVGEWECSLLVTVIQHNVVTCIICPCKFVGAYKCLGKTQCPNVVICTCTCTFLGWDKWYQSKFKPNTEIITRKMYNIGGGVKLVQVCLRMHVCAIGYCKGSLVSQVHFVSSLHIHIHTYIQIFILGSSMWRSLRSPNYTLQGELPHS